MKPRVLQDPGERSSDPPRDWPRLAHECPGVSSGGVGQSGLLQDSDNFKWGCIYLHYLHHSLAPGQTTGRGHSPAHQQKIGLKIYWAKPWPSEYDPFSPSVTLSHQEASISLPYPSPSEDRQNENHIHRKQTKMITWTTTLSNSMKLWAMPCRATQDVWVMVESSTRQGPLEKAMANHFSILKLRTPWIIWKSKKIGNWKMNSTGQYMPNMLLEISGKRNSERWRDRAKAKSIPNCGYDWW